MDPSSDAPPTPPRPGYYRVTWSVDLPKDEFPTPRDAAFHACELAGDCSGPANVFVVVDGDDGLVTEHDLAPARWKVPSPRGPVATDSRVSGRRSDGA